MLRKFTIDDAEDIFEYDSDSEVARYGRFWDVKQYAITAEEWKNSVRM